MASATPTEKQPDKFLPNLRIPADLYEELFAAAKANDRTVAAEVRRAIRKHLRGAA